MFLHARAKDNREKSWACWYNWPQTRKFRRKFAHAHSLARSVACLITCLPASGSHPARGASHLWGRQRVYTVLIFDELDLFARDTFFFDPTVCQTPFPCSIAKRGIGPCLKPLLGLRLPDTLLWFLFPETSRPKSVLRRRTSAGGDRII